MDKLEQIREMLSRLATLDRESLDALRALIVEAGDEIDALPDTDENIAALMEVADAGEQVMARDAELVAAAEKATADKAAARDRIAKIKNNGEDPDAEDPDAVVDPDAELDGEPAKDGEPVAVAASGTTVSKMARSRPSTPAGPEVEPDANGRRFSLTASRELQGFHSGDVVPDRMALAVAMCRNLDRMTKRDKARGDVVLASSEWSYPEDRRLTDDPERNAEILDAATHPMSLRATGGICSPVNIDWSLDTWAIADRPLRDGFAGFQSTRGGLTYRPPANITDLAGATAVWTEATDADPGSAVKPVIHIECPTPVTIYADAVSTRLGFGNMQARFDPETVANNTDIAIAAAARIAEANLLTALQAFCVGNVTCTAELLGGTRDLLATLDNVIAAFKDWNRLSDNQMLTVVWPRWVRNLIRADRVRELAHDGSSVDPLAIPDAYIDSLFSMRNIKPIWTLEGMPAQGDGDYPSQNFTEFTMDTIVPEFPDSLMWNLYIEGAIQFLDGGRLDLGVVRDSTLDATNDYETFTETFEGLANRSFVGGVLQIVTALCPTGGSAATVDTHTLCA
jgi:hypothetical protein